MSKRLEAKVDRIMSDAYEQAWVHVRREVYKMMKRNPRRFKCFWNAVGWGPTFFGPDGKAVDEDDMNARERVLAKYLDEFYDTYGGNNEKVEI